MESYKGTGSVHLAWEPFFTVDRDVPLNGYNVYRRMAQEEFDNEKPINKILVDAGSTHYIDDALHSVVPPVPKTVYYYEVRPVIADVETRTKEVFSLARILVPGENMSFVHRRIVNKRMCGLLGRRESEIDALNHNRCVYHGPGGGMEGKYYDIEQDFLVSTFEASCPYTVGVSSCNTVDGNCIADRFPSNDGDGLPGDFFFNRENGKCYWKDTNNSTWGVVDGEIDNSLFQGRGSDIVGTYAFGDMAVKRILKAHGPPLAFVSQEAASSLCRDDSMGESDILVGCSFSLKDCDTPDSKCTSDEDPDNLHGNYAARQEGAYFWNSLKRRCWMANSTTPGDWTRVGGIANNLTAPDTMLSMRLPHRKEQIAFSFWDEYLSHDAITKYEAGSAPVATRSCNSNEARTFEFEIMDGDAPFSYSLHTLPATEESGIRTLATGVKETENCRSIFGVRDFVGNVTEWSEDRALCSSPGSCQLIPGQGSRVNHFLVNSDSSRIDDAGGFVLGWYDGNGNGVMDDWSIDGFPIGPCLDRDNDELCDITPMFAWKIADEFYNAENFIIPMGLPGHRDFSENYERDIAKDSFVKVGNNEGITANELHHDTMEINSDTAYCPYDEEHQDCGGYDCTTIGTTYGTPDGRITPRS
ncbi:MAG: hypothetical protein OXE43_15910, partial [Chloroflexi bacterium]|nr:hypothetical protein [Chloroflexota bacterium]